ncbi:MAG TPA: hypothetical protein VED20_03315, partial [Streptosporangiaceae bacterium]|nr:hypothetical protein [Streptosporangiaceae bacterium]
MADERRDEQVIQAWNEHRPYLVDLAFRMLGDIGAAEDVAPPPSRSAPNAVGPRRAASRAASRQPSRLAPRNASATKTNATAVPCPATTRSTMPRPAAPSHAATP